MATEKKNEFEIIEINETMLQVKFILCAIRKLCWILNWRRYMGILRKDLMNK